MNRKVISSSEVISIVGELSDRRQSILISRYFLSVLIRLTSAPPKSLPVVVALTSNNNVVTKIELESGIILKNQKISGSVLSEPFIYNESLYIVKNGSIIQYE